MSLEDRAVEFTILEECWSLIQIGHNQKQIKISKDHIYLNGILHGKVVNFNVLETIPNLRVNQYTINSLLTHKSTTRSSHPDVCSVISSYNNPKSQNSNHAKIFEFELLQFKKFWEKSSLSMPIVALDQQKQTGVIFLDFAKSI